MWRWDEIELYWRNWSLCEMHNRSGLGSGKWLCLRLRTDVVELDFTHGHVWGYWRWPWLKDGLQLHRSIADFLLWTKLLHTTVFSINPRTIEPIHVLLTVSFFHKSWWCDELFRAWVFAAVLLDDHHALFDGFGSKAWVDVISDYITCCHTDVFVWKVCFRT